MSAHWTAACTPPLLSPPSGALYKSLACGCMLPPGSGKPVIFFYFLFSPPPDLRLVAHCRTVRSGCKPPGCLHRGFEVPWAVRENYFKVVPRSGRFRPFLRGCRQLVVLRGAHLCRELEAVSSGGSCSVLVRRAVL